MVFAKEKVAVAIDISDGFVKIAAIAGENSLRSLYALDIAQLSTGKGKEAAKEIRSLLSKNKLGKYPIFVSFPRHLVTVRNVRLPTLNEEEIRDMAELQAVKHLPYSQEEIVTAYKTIGVTRDGYTDIMLVLAQKKSVYRYIDLFRYAGIFVEKLALSSEGIYNWFSILDMEAGGPVAVIDFDRSHAHILVIKGRGLLFSRSVSFDITDPDSDKNILLREIRMSLDLFHKENNESVSRVVLSGSENYSKDFSIFLRDDISIPCEPAGQLAKIAVKGRLKSRISQLKGVSYTHLIGIASSPESLVVDLLPRDMIDARKSKAVKSELLKAGALFLSVITAGFGVMEKKVIEKKAYLRAIEERLEEIDPEVKRLKSLKKSIDLIQGQLSFEGSSIDIMREVYEILPANISLTLLEFEDKNRVLLRGTTKELSAAFDLLSLLEKSPFFGKVKINYANKRMFKNTEFADFEIVCALGERDDK